MTDYIADYRTWLQEEKHASDNTLSSYLRDINQFKTWLLGAGSPDPGPLPSIATIPSMIYSRGFTYWFRSTSILAKLSALGYRVCPFAL